MPLLLKQQVTVFLFCPLFVNILEGQQYFRRGGPHGPLYQKARPYISLAKNWTTPDQSTYLDTVSFVGYEMLSLEEL